MTEGIATDDNFRRTHIHQWLGRMAASVIEKIGEQPVYEPFKATKFTRVPRIIEALPLQDVVLAMALGHMYTYGPRLNCGDQTCPKCGREGAYKAVNLVRQPGETEGGIELMPGTIPDVEEIIVKLPTGYLWEKPAVEKRTQPYYGKVWNVYVFHVPRLADWILREQEYGTARFSDYQMRVYSDCLLRVERWEDGEPDGEGGWTGGTKVEEVSGPDMELEVQDLLGKIDSRDHLVIRQEIQKAPQVRMSLREECKACHRVIRLPLNPVDFFPVG